PPLPATVRRAYARRGSGHRREAARLPLRNRRRRGRTLSVDLPALPAAAGRRRPGCAVGPRVRLRMATEPADLLQTIARFGPHRAYAGGERLETSAEPEHLVKTHCCFCGQQCGIQLKVKDNQVIGFEPWEDFPFNQGMLCPKGVKRYL